MYDKCINILSEYGINKNTVENMVNKILYDKQKEQDSTNYYMKSALELLTGRRLFCIPYKTFTRVLLIIKHSIM